VGSPGTYWVVGTDATGCEARDTIEITANTDPPLDLGPDLNICPGDSLTLDAGIGFVSYMWSDSSTGQTLLVLAPGVYGVVVVDSAGCTGSDDVTVSDTTNPALNLGPDTMICAGDTLILDAGAGFLTYLWSDSSTGQTFTVDTLGTYWVEVVDSFGCSATDTIVVTDCDSLLGGGSRFGVSIYPNPTSGNISVNYRLILPDYVTVEVWSTGGRRMAVLYEGYSDGMGQITDFSVLDMPPGIYIVKVRAANGYEHHRKFVFMK
jgi:hypothetical protein